MLDSLLSRFANETVLASSEHQLQFEGCLKGLAAHERFKDFMEAGNTFSAADTFWLPEDDWRAAYRPYNVVNGILHVPVSGVLMSRFPWATGWATGYTYIQKAVERGDADPDVKGIALISHSPGGEVAQCFDMMDKLVARKGTKPMQAFAHEYAYSAAYVTVIPSDKINVSRTGGVGSIGVVTSHVDLSKALEQSGIKITFISAPKNGHKTEGNPYEPLSEAARERIQARIDGMYEMFVDAVSQNRGMSDKDVRGTKALTFTAQDAVKNGLADAIGTLEDTMAAFSAEIDTGEDQMADVKQDDHERLVAAAKDEGMKSGKTEGFSAGAKAQQDRINAILASDEGKARPKAALSAALKTDLSVDAAKAFLADLPEEKGESNAGAKSNMQDFSAAMGGSAPKVGAGNDKGTGNGEENDPDASVKLSRDLAKAWGLPGYKD